MQKHFIIKIETVHFKCKGNIFANYPEKQASCVDGYNYFIKRDN